MVQYDFDGTTAVVTGAASGIGRQTALEFARHGASVVVADVDDNGAAETVDLIADGGGEAVAVHTDVTEMSDVERMVETAVDEFGSLDYAVNNAGIGGAQEPTGDLDEADWERIVDINLNGVWRSLSAEVDHMVGQDGGVIVNMASVLGHVGFQNASAYVAAKHGVLGLTKTAAWEYADDDIRVNAVCPGFIETNMLEEGGITSDEQLRQEIAGRHSQNRLGEPEEIAAAVVWLCSDAASFTNGEPLTVDSGYRGI